MKILVIKLGSLGDIIISTPIIKRIQEHYLNEEFWLLTTPSFVDFFSEWEGLHVIAFPRKGISAFFKTVSWIRSQNFDCLYDLQSNDRTTLLSSLSQIKLRAGNHPRYPYHIHPDSSYNGECHIFNRLNILLSKANIAPAEPEPIVPTTGEEKNKINHWLKTKELIDNHFAIIHAGSSSSHPEKRWPYYADLAEELYKHDLKIVWIGSDDDIEINKKLSAKYGIDATKNFTIPELIELGRHARFAITNDSAPMHILSCSKIPLFGLFGPTNPTRNHALGQKDRVITSLQQFPKNDQAFSPANINLISCNQIIQRLEDENLL